MAAQTDVRFGLAYGWTLGESGWNSGMDANLLKLGRVGVHLSIKDRDLTAPPGSPAVGDTYIVGPSATGAWVGKDGQVTMWDGAAWVFYVPRKGWNAYIEDEEVMCVYKTSWGTGRSTNHYAAVSMTADANKTLTAAETAAGILNVTSTVSLTATRGVVLAALNARQLTVRNGTTGGQAIQVIGATGTGVTIATGKTAIVFSDGTNVLRATADV